MPASPKTPLFKKLDLRDGFKVAIVAAPKSYLEYIDSLKFGLDYEHTDGLNWVHLFCNQKLILEASIQKYRYKILQNGIIWVSWYKKSSKKQNEINEDTIREIAFQYDLVDIKVCSVDEEWSGLKLVIRKNKRTEV